MPNDVSRRAFMERLGACALGGAMLSQGPEGSARGASPPGWQSPPVFTNPNILVVMVDQMRSPAWLNASQAATVERMLPNINGLVGSSYVFDQFYVAATVCTASRGTFLTGLYAPQTAVYVGGAGSVMPNMNPAFPTWGWALQALNPAYYNNCWWFGKWHLCNCAGSTPLANYGFRTNNFPGGPAHNPDPTGRTNEGTNGGVFGNQHWAKDADIADDFVSWLGKQSASGQPWCATVSFVNPHDMANAPGWLYYPAPQPPNLIPGGVWFEPPSPFAPPGAPMVYSPDVTPNQTLPSPWNFEDLPRLGQQGKGGVKPDVQLAFQNGLNASLGAVTDWTDLLNKYYWLQAYVDQQVGAVLAALRNSPFASNTIVIFTSDHGEYAGSHGLHDKGLAAYDESLHVPLFVQFPGQTCGIPMNQMCSSVDIFRLICDLGTRGQSIGSTFASRFPDQLNRQRLWDFLYFNSGETRLAPQLGNIPYIFHTCDVTNDTPGVSKVHVVCLRGKTACSQPAKMAIYFEWAKCTTYPDGLAQDYEFYDYSPPINNTAEVGNNYSRTNPSPLQKAYMNAMGNWGGWSSPTPGSGLIATELNAPLAGVSLGGTALSEAQAAGQQSYLTFTFGSSGCP